jgi:hypothetical protein
MKYLLSFFLLVASAVSSAVETIKIYSPYSPTHSGTPAMLRIIEQANVSQNIYRFVLEFRPGGNQLIAIKSMDPENSLAVIAPSFVEHAVSGALNRNDYIPVHSLGNACWAVIANKPLTDAKEFVVGGVAFGNATHLTALALGEKYGFNSRYIVFKSNNDALINLAGGNGIELVVDRFEAYQALVTKNKNIQVVAVSCPERLPQIPKVKTLQELGIAAPYIFNITVSHASMNAARRQAISMILNDATVKVGKNEIFRLSAMRPPVFDKKSDLNFFTDSIELVSKLQSQFKTQINSDKQ